MANERSSITQIVNFGAEATATPGTAVVSGKQMTALSLVTDPTINFDRFRPSGYKYATIEAPGKDFVQATLTGSATYTELVYPMSSLLGVATITTPGGGTSSRNWAFNPSSTANDTPNTFTVEQGSSVRAHKFSYGLVTGLTLGFDREKITMSGAMLGQALSDGITLTSTATTVALVPILAKQVTVYSDATSGSLGSSTLGRVLSAELSITNKYMPLWVVNASQTSFVTHVDVEPQARFKIVTEADAAGMAHLTNARAQTTEFIRLKAVGDVIEAGTITYAMTFDMACKVMNVGAFSDTQGVYAMEFEYDLVYDSGWGKAFVASLVNTLTAL